MCPTQMYVHTRTRRPNTDVTNPTIFQSDKYGQHWSAKEVAEAFAPTEETVKAVKAWLASYGFGDEHVEHTQSLGFLQFNASVEDVEELLNTKYNIYQHDETKQPHVACEEYSIPSHLTDHIDFITPTVHFDAIVKEKKKKRESVEKRTIEPGVEKGLGEPNSPSLPKLGHYMSEAAILRELIHCNQQIIPDCLRALYDFPRGKYSLDKNAFGIVEYTPQAYIPSDLDMFFRQFSKKAVGERPILHSIDGGVVQQTNQSFEYNGESDLDLEYAVSALPG
jgi:tripeptidyl-peptidase I